MKQRTQEGVCKSYEKTPFYIGRYWGITECTIGKSPGIDSTWRTKDNCVSKWAWGSVMSPLLGKTPPSIFLLPPSLSETGGETD